MIVATLPEPTVLPPSRFSVMGIIVFLDNFQGIFNGFLLDMHLVSDVFQIFVIMVLSRNELHPVSPLMRSECVSTQKNAFRNALKLIYMNYLITA